MAKTRAELVQALVFVMVFLSGESRTSGEREAIARCCPGKDMEREKCNRELCLPLRLFLFSGYETQSWSLFNLIDDFLIVAFT